MSRKFRPRSIYDVFAVLALVVALGGTSAWATHEVINSSDVVNESLTGADIQNGTLTGQDVFDNTIGGADITNGSLTGADVFDNTIGGADVTNNSLSGADINESSLAKVPDADQLDGVDSSAFQRVGLVQARFADQTESEGFPFLASWDELAHITTDGDADADDTIRILNTASQNIGVQGETRAAIFGPGAVITWGVDIFTPFIVFSADGVRSWQVTCLRDSFTPDLIRCHGVANRVG
jgi:hypothetical protein